jgi:hypothetical protein
VFLWPGVEGGRTIAPWQGTEALVALAKDTSPIEAMDIVLCVDSPMIDQVCFTMPLVSYSDGRWQHCFQAEVRAVGWRG